MEFVELVILDTTEASVGVSVLHEFIETIIKAEGTF